jgi:hypothetical protein
MTSIPVYGYKKAFAILLIIISVSILTIIGFTNTVYNTSTTTTNPNLQYQSSYNQCDHAHSLHVKMFDNEIVPKYIIGKDYKIIPVSPTTTDGLVNGCSLAAEAISQ